MVNHSPTTFAKKFGTCLTPVSITAVNFRRVSSELAAILKQQNNFNNNITLSGIDFYQRADGVDDVYMSSKSMLDSEESTPKSR